MSKEDEEGFSPKELMKNKFGDTQAKPGKVKKKLSKKNSKYEIRYIDGIKHMILRSDAY